MDQMHTISRGKELNIHKVVREVQASHNTRLIGLESKDSIIDFLVGEVAKLNVAIGTLPMDGPPTHLTPRDGPIRDGASSSSDNDNPLNDDERAVTTTTPKHTPIVGRRLSHLEVLKHMTDHMSGNPEANEVDVGSAKTFQRGLDRLPRGLPMVDPS